MTSINGLWYILFGQNIYILGNLGYWFFDQKSYSSENTYRDQGVTTTKKECVGHVQKRVGTALRKLKKEKKGLMGRVS